MSRGFLRGCVGFGSRPSVTPARQAGGAIGIAASGAIASTPDQLRPSLIGLHTTVLTTAGLFTPAALATAQ